MHRGTYFDDVLLARAALTLLPLCASPDHVLHRLAALDPQHWHSVYLRAVRHTLLAWRQRVRPRRPQQRLSLAYVRAITPVVPHCRRCQRWVDGCLCAPAAAAT
jgi:hypothetical protein